MQYEIVVVGTSLGGLNALQALLAELPKDFPLPVREADDQQPIAPGVVYLAPADYYLLVEVGEFLLSTDAPVVFSRPSVEVLFESAADAYGPGGDRRGLDRSQCGWCQRRGRDQTVRRPRPRARPRYG
jgi:two-component system, chemotaxis family, protein-glutamate methylesterase/glutaminase